MPMITHDGTNFSQTPTAGDTWEHEGIRRTLNTNGAWKESDGPTSSTNTFDTLLPYFTAIGLLHN
ncbi:MAG TPA: hypothetical protein EYO74_04545 [Piscirickettsiaceae bacterium]|nr:hypothetical protein [Piscirickettsiaceae bacterium]